MTRAIFIIALLMVCAACSGERVAGPPQPGETIHLPPIEWRIVDAPELRRVYADAGMPIGPKDKLHGFVGKHRGRVVIYTLPPRTVDGQETTTLGHEVMHVALGDYHD